MHNKDTIARPESSFRQRAEEDMKKKGRSANLSEVDVRALCHELEVHQVELEMQNEELRRVHAELAASEEKYRDLYEFAPIGYLTLEGSGKILEANLAAATILGTERAYLIKNQFQAYLANGSISEFRAFCSRVMDSGVKQTAELQLRGAKNDDHAPAWILAVGKYIHNGVNSGFRIALSDITDRKRAEEALLESEEKFRLVADFTYDWEVWLGTKGNYVYVSPSCERITGHSAEEFMKNPRLALDIVHPDDKATFERHRNDHISEKSGPGKVDFRIVTTNGETRWISHLCQPVFGKNGEWLGRRGGNRDITERKLMEEELRKAQGELEMRVRERTEELQKTYDILKKSEQLFHAAIDNFPDVFVIYDRDLHIQYVNRTGIIKSCLSKEEIIGHTDEELFPAEVTETYMDWLKKALESGIIQTFESRHTLPPGTTTVIVSYVPLMDEQGKVNQILGITHDITELKKAEEGLRAAWAYNRSLIEASLDPLVTIGPDGKITDVNAATESVTGYRLEELIGTDFSDYFTEPESARAGYEKAFREGYVRDYPLEIQARDGHKTPVLYNASVYENEEGQVVGIFAAARDITELKRAEEELIRAKEAAEAAAEIKSAFMANMSHELRTPMNYIIGMTSLLLGEPLTPELKEYIETIRKGGDEMMVLINDILDFTKMESDNAVLEYQPLSLRALVEESLEMVASKAAKKGLNLAFNVNYGTPDNIVSDHGRLRQVLINLLSNAVKFTDEGDISLSVSSEPLQKANKHQILFAVKDTGIGISPEKMSELFQPFAQVETAFSRKRDGVGLGLAASKKIAKLMGGDVWVKSEIGKGSTFYLSVEVEVVPDDGIGGGIGIKAKPEGTTKAIPEKLAEQCPLAILVAEDIPSNQKVLLEMLKRMGYRADAVADGMEVLKALEMRHYDLILMDVMMPEMDGIEAAKEIRRRWPNDGPKIIAITAYALAGDREKCLAAGMDGYISKPVQKEDLARALKDINRL